MGASPTRTAKLLGKIRNAFFCESKDRDKTSVRPLLPQCYSEVAQLVEHFSDKEAVEGANPSLRTKFFSEVAQCPNIR